MFKLNPSYPDFLSANDESTIPNSYHSDHKNLEHLRKSFFDNGILCLDYCEPVRKNLYSCFSDIIAVLGKKPIRDAARREVVVEDIKESLSSVDYKYSHVDPHAETSFSPSRPSIIGFVCTDIDKAAQAAGKTIIVDGFKSWSTLSLNLREKLQSSYLEYDLNISLNSSKRIKGSRPRPWYLDYEGVSKVMLNPETQSIRFNQNSFPSRPSIAQKSLHRKPFLY